MSRSSSPAKKAAVLLYAESERGADQLYFAGFRVGDPFITFAWRGQRFGVLNALEFGRARKESSLDRVLPLEDWTATAKQQLKVEQAGPAEVIATLARSFKIPAFRVAADFPFGLALKLQKLRVKLEPVDGELFPQREVKTPAEARAIAEGNRCSAVGFAAAEALLRKATIARDGRLMLGRATLTSERLREEIEVACLRAGAVSLNTIAAGGDQACDPHCVGHGPLRARELIIVDIFPRVVATGFHGDMTRTFLKGAPSDAQVKLVAAVRAAHGEAIAAVRAGIDGRTVHDGVVEHFKKAGYETKRGPRGAVGFFHGTGHGLGLEVHEGPSLGRRESWLKKGAVVTVEPGLYYPGLGGCRIEDVVQVTAGKPKLLSDYHYRWVIR
jgi:Xaa-Pro aminopeptidase